MHLRKEVKMTESSQQFIRIYELPQYLRISETSVWRAIKRGDLPPPIRLGRRAKGYRVTTLDNWLDQQQGARGGVL